MKRSPLPVVTTPQARYLRAGTARGLLTPPIPVVALAARGLVILEEGGLEWRCEITDAGREALAFFDGKVDRDGRTLEEAYQLHKAALDAMIARRLEQQDARRARIQEGIQRQLRNVEQNLNRERSRALRDEAAKAALAEIAARRRAHERDVAKRKRAEERTRARKAKKKTERVRTMRELRLSGSTFKDIGAVYGVTGSYAQQLIKAYEDARGLEPFQVEEENP